MQISESAIELSVIVPVLNEEEGIVAFVTGLAAQQAVSFQVILCDGGSTDGTVKKITPLIKTLPFPLNILHTEKGRALQMNAGAREATGEYFLFLHADSTFPDPYAFSKSLALLRQAEQKAGGKQTAARFSLRFQVGSGTIPFSYYFAAGKARLERSGCTHGDQGFLLSRHFFAKAGPFDQSCLVMEDTRFAENVRSCGSWLLLPAELVTSPRRFESEGRAVRHVLNMIIMTLDAVERDDFMCQLPRVYAAQSMTVRLRLYPYLERIRQLIRDLPIGTRVKFWLSVGRYVSLNAWQIPFFLDMRRNRRKHVPAGEGKTPCLNFFTRHGEPLLQNRPVTVLAAGLTILLFYTVLPLARVRDW